LELKGGVNNEGSKKEGGTSKVTDHQGISFPRVAAVELETEKLANSPTGQPDKGCRGRG